MKKIVSVLTAFFFWTLALLAVLAVSCAALWAYVSRPMTPAGSEAHSEKINVPAGTSVKAVSRILCQKGLVRSPAVFYYAARFNVFDRSKAFSLKSGTYTLSSAMSLRELYEALQSGAQEYITVSIPEGMAMSKIARILEEKNICAQEAFAAVCRDRGLLAEYGIPAASFEGYLFPDTYFFIPQMEAVQVLRSFAVNFFEKIQEVPGLGEKRGKALHDIVILSSIIEREYRLKEEAPVIASVFSNRLKDGIGLYSCATIEYILTEIQGKPHPERITYDDLKINSLYNTYKWAGLPEGPISNPGLVALNAAANPAQTDFYFFVLSDPDTGRHTFSRNFDQHKAAESASSYHSKDSR